jgi:hypothetical protein
MLETLTLAAGARFLLGLVTKPVRFLFDFGYVLSHWGEISKERNEYRQQIKDRDEWLASLKTNMTATHAAEKERIVTEFGALMDNQVKATQDALAALDKMASDRDKLLAAYERAIEAERASIRDNRNQAIADLLDAVTILGITLAHAEPEHQRDMLYGVRPSVRKATELVVRALETSEKPDFVAIRYQVLRVLIPARPASLKDLMTDPDR